MPGARPPPQNFQAGTLKDVGRALEEKFGTAQANPNELLSLEKKKFLPRTSLKETDRVASVLFYCSINAVLSASLIAFNKYLMHAERFPYPVPLVLLHSSSSSIFVGLFLLFHRGCSQGSVDTSGFFSALPQALTESSLKPKIFGLGALFAAQLAFSNAAYLFSSVVFIQMMKEGNLAFVYVLSVCAAMEVVHWQRIQVLLCIVFATLMTIKGEINFTWIGFAIQLAGQSFEGMRIVLQAMVLNAKGVNLDVLTYMLLVMPVCALILGTGLVFNSCLLQVSAISTPSLYTTLAWGPELVANALLAVALNFSTALVVKHVSAVGLVVSGIMKDSAIVLAGAYFLKESISSIQVVGFTIQILGVLLYSFIKLYPDRFDDGILLGIKRILGIEASLPVTTQEPSYQQSQPKPARPPYRLATTEEPSYGAAQA